jgi:hypothetical protein
MTSVRIIKIQVGICCVILNKMITCVEGGIILKQILNVGSDCVD